MSQKTSHSKNTSQLHELWVNVDPSEMRIRPNLLIIMLNSYKIIFHFSGTNPQIVLLISRNVPVNNPLYCPPTVIIFQSDREMTGDCGSRLWMSSRNRWVCEKQQSCSPAKNATNRNPQLTCPENIEQWKSPQQRISQGFPGSINKKKMELQMLKYFLHFFKKIKGQLQLSHYHVLNKVD